MVNLYVCKSNNSDDFFDREFLIRQFHVRMNYECKKYDRKDKNYNINNEYYHSYKGDNYSYFGFSSYNLLTSSHLIYNPYSLEDAKLDLFIYNFIILIYELALNMHIYKNIPNINKKCLNFLIWASKKIRLDCLIENNISIINFYDYFKNHNIYDEIFNLVEKKIILITPLNFLLMFKMINSYDLTYNILWLISNSFISLDDIIESNKITDDITGSIYFFFIKEYCKREEIIYEPSMDNRKYNTIVIKNIIEENLNKLIYQKSVDIYSLCVLLSDDYYVLK